jgi:hypothetical protein
MNIIAPMSRKASSSLNSMDISFGGDDAGI